MGSKLMLRMLALLLLIALASCASTDPAAPLLTESLTPAETVQVDSLLEEIYRSFSYGEDEEPDWELIRVDVAFQAMKANDPAPRKPGLDSLVLANVGGAWRILSFIVQYESKL